MTAPQVPVTVGKETPAKVERKLASDGQKLPWYRGGVARSIKERDYEPRYDIMLAE